MSNTTYPATSPANSAQAQVQCVVVGSVDVNGNFQPATAAAGLPVAGGGGGGSSLSDVLLTDSNGVLFVGRDQGGTSGTIFTYYRLDTQAAYTPVGTIKAAGNNVVTIADGADVTQGAIADAAVAAGAAGTANAHLRAISRDIGALVTGPVNVIGSVSTTAATDATASGSITVLNSNLNSGTATVGSTVAITGLNGAGTLRFEVQGTWTGVLVAQSSVDGSNWVNLPVFNQLATPASTTQNVPNTNGEFTVAVTGSPAVRITASSAITGSATITMRVTSVSLSPAPLTQAVNLLLIGGNSPLTSINNGGGTGAAQTVGIASSTTQVAYSAVSVVTSALTGLTAIAETSGTGTVCSFFVNLTAFTAGSSTGLDFFIQYSPDGGTNWVNLTQVAAFTATGTADIPAIYIPGRWRFAYQNRGGAATTATVTITATRLNLPLAYIQKQWYDRTASVLAGTPINSATPAYDMTGCKIITASVTIASVTTTGAAYQVQTSADNANWSSVGTASTTLTAGTTTDIVVTNNTKRYARVIVSTAAVGAQVGTVIAITGSN